ncbi:hypothetical protein ACFLXY_09710 [Chloroflexota bacterium]
MSTNSTQYSIKIAEIIARFSSENTTLTLHPFYTKFATSIDKKPDIEVKVFWGDIPELDASKLIFNSGITWSLYDWQNRYVFKITSPAVKPNLYKMAIFERDFSQGDVYIRIYPDRGIFDPLEYPLDELLFINYLAQGKGIDIHGCGIILDYQGFAFVGVSGSGKSTISRLWGERDVKILSDDRLIVRMHDDGLWVHGTPWHGDAYAALPNKAPLRSIYFLKQDKSNNIISLPPLEVAERLIVRSFPTFYNKQGMEYTLDLINNIATSVPGFELQFTPDESAINTVLNHVKNLT